MELEEGSYAGTEWNLRSEAERKLLRDKAIIEA